MIDQTRRRNLRAGSLEGHLLRAAFSTGEGAIAAWEVWKQAIDWDDHLDLGSFRLLPQLYRNLLRLEMTDPLLLKFKGVAHQNWFKNQRFLAVIAPLLKALHETGIELMLLDGAAMVVRYPEYALDSNANLAVLVRPERADAAIMHLLTRGWTPEAKRQTRPHETGLENEFMRLSQAATGRRIQLQWQLLPKSCSLGEDAEFWARSLETRTQNVPVCLLCPTDQILHTCVQDNSLSRNSLFQRSVDVMLMIHAHEATIEWSRLLEQAQECQLLVPLLRVLRHLQANLDVRLTNRVLRHVQAVRLSRKQHLELQLTNSGIVFWRRFWRLWFNYMRRTRKSHVLLRIIGFPRFLQRWWGLEGLWEVPRHAVRRIVAGILSPHR